MFVKSLDDNKHCGEPELRNFIACGRRAFETWSGSIVDRWGHGIDLGHSSIIPVYCHIIRAIREKRSHVTTESYRPRWPRIVPLKSHNKMTESILADWNVKISAFVVITVPYLHFSSHFSPQGSQYHAPQTKMLDFSRHRIPNRVLTILKRCVEERHDRSFLQYPSIFLCGA